MESSNGRNKAVLPDGRLPGSSYTTTGLIEKECTPMNSDFKELLQVFSEHKVEYMVVGGYAAIHYSQPRYTKDLDIWIRPSEDNAIRIAQAFAEFGLPMHEFTLEDLAEEGFQFFVGVSPVAFDFLTTIKGLVFDEAWGNREKSDQEGFPIWYVGKADLITAKKAVGREQDLHDIDEMNRAGS